MTADAAAADIRRLAVLHVARGAKDFDAKLPAKEFDFGEDGPRFDSDIRVTGNVSIVDDQVISQIKVRAGEVASCSRCLEDVKRPFEKDFFLAFELTKERYIDLVPHIREEMLLEQPLQVLCRPNCKGLCARCGANLNAGSCGCAKRS